MPMSIVGIGAAVPPHTISQADAAEITQALTCRTPDQERLFRKLYGHVGVETRHSAILDASCGDVSRRQSFFTADDPTTAQRMDAFHAHAPGLAVVSAAAALADAEIEAGRVTHLVTVSCSGFCAPGVDVALIKRLGLRSDVARTNVGFMGCHGAINGLRVARAFIEADPKACVLLSATELCTVHHQYEFDAGVIVANALFADGSAAVVAVGDGSRPPLFHVVANGSGIVADSEDAMSWRIGDHGFAMKLASSVPGLIAANLRPWLDAWLEPLGHSVETIGSWAVHPGGPRILTAFGEATGVPRSMLDPSYQVLARYGNMSSPTVLFILDLIRKGRRDRPCVVLGFGPGLAIEAALLD